MTDEIQEIPAADTPATEETKPLEEATRLYTCTVQHGIKYRGKRIPTHHRFEAYPSEMEGMGLLAKGFVEEVQTSAIGHSEDEEEK